jgi:hypothetical protein
MAIDDRRPRDIGITDSLAVKERRERKDVEVKR